MPEEVQTLRSLHETIGLLLDVEDVAPELRTELELDLRKAILARGEKLDSIANVLLHLEENAAMKEASAQVYADKAAKLRASAAAFQRDAKRLGDYVLGVMGELPKPKKGVRTLEGISSTFKAKGVADSVEVCDLNELPDELQLVRLTYRRNDWIEFLQLLESREITAVAAIELSEEIHPAPKAQIKAALEKRVPCKVCESSEDPKMAVEDLNDCPFCRGEKTIPATVPGARLITGKLRLEVS